MEKHVCEVCSILDNDDQEKSCFFCNKCNAWICAADKFNLGRRALATFKKNKKIWLKIE